MKTIIKPQLIIFFSFLSFFGCRKNKDVGIVQPKKAVIVVSESIGATNVYNYYGSNEKYNSVDTLVVDTAFYLIKIPSTGTYYQNGPRLNFKAVADENYSAKFEWVVGNDPLIRTARSFSLDFEQPVGRILIKLVAKYYEKNDGLKFVRADTVYQHISVTEGAPFMGEYEGYNVDSPSRTFRIKIGWQYEPYPAINGSYFALSNLPEGFPVKSEIFPKSMGFGIFDPNFRSGLGFFYRNEWVNTPFGLGFSNSKTDSITVRYNYGVINNYLIYFNGMDWSRVVAKKFIGKKI